MASEVAIGSAGFTQAGLKVVLFQPVDAIGLVWATYGKPHSLSGSALGESEAVTGYHGPGFWIATYGLSIIQQNDGVTVRGYLYSAKAGGFRKQRREP